MVQREKSLNGHKLQIHLISFLAMFSNALPRQPINLINDAIKLIKTRIIALEKVVAIHREGKIYCLHIIQLHFFSPYQCTDLSHVCCCSTTAACARARRVLDQIYLSLACGLNLNSEWFLHFI
jgi:hypothetical protein